MLGEIDMGIPNADGRLHQPTRQDLRRFQMLGEPKGVFAFGLGAPVSFFERLVGSLARQTKMS